MPVPHSAPSAQKPVPVLNLGVLAHVDAGKTSLTERLLYHAGVVPELGSVDRGTTTTDSLDLERRRGITIRTAVASFTLPTPAGPRLVDLVDDAGGVQEPLGEAGLTGVDVRQDAQVQGVPGDACLHCVSCPRRRWLRPG